MSVPVRCRACGGTSTKETVHYSTTGPPERTVEKCPHCENGMVFKTEAKADDEPMGLTGTTGMGNIWDVP